MKRLVLASALAAACAGAPKPVAEPRPAMAPTKPTPPRLLPFPDSTTATRVPAFRTEPILAAWGPLPAGVPHPERVPTYHIQHQIIHVRFDWPRHAVVGSTTIRVAALDTALRDVALDAVGMTNIRVHFGTTGAPLRYTYNDTTLTVHLAARVRPNAATTFTVEYETVKPTKGIYFIDRRHDLWSQGETDDTRYWVPTYDYPNDKTTWEIYVRVPKDEKALSNGRLVGTRLIPSPAGDEVEWHWSLDEPASTYLMTVATGDYTVLHDSVRVGSGDSTRVVPVDYWVYPDSTDAGWRGFGVTPGAVALFSKKIGVPYPWAKYDQIVVPNFVYGGMENVTATTQNDDAILHPAWAEPQANTDGLVSHELAHQWFGDYLTTRSWPHIWLNEGFATFMEQIHAEAKRGVSEGALERLAAQEQTIAADRQARRPIVYDRWQTDPIELFFSGHIYPKGATVLHMLRHDLGDSLFWAGMHRYTVDHANNTVVTADFERAMEQTSGRDYSTFFKQWVYGAGFPIFQVSTAYDPAAHTVTFTARQVQPRDSLTGFFDAKVDVEVLTDSGPVDGVVPVHGEVSTATIPVRAAPRSVRWDKGRWVLQLYDFPRSTNMLSYQLSHDDDALGRIEAVTLLGERAPDPIALAALTAAATHDQFWAVRGHAVTVLAQWAADSARDSVARSALLTASQDSDARVRQRAALVLGKFPGPATEARLRDLAADSSRFVRGAALAAFVAVDSAAAMPLIQDAMSHASWLDTEKKQAQAALGAMQRTGP